MRLINILRQKKELFIYLFLHSFFHSPACVLPVHSSPGPTCKLPVAVATVTELGDQLAVELEDEDAAGFVVHHDDVAVPVHGDAFRAHQLPGADLVLEESGSGVTGSDVTCERNVPPHAYMSTDSRVGLNTDKISQKTDIK